MTRYDRLPEHMRESARQYVEEGRATGRFLTAVLENKLVEAYSYADDENTAAMRAWAGWLYSDISADAWGSPEKVAAWRKLHDDRRTAAADVKGTP